MKSQRNASLSCRAVRSAKRISVGRPVFAILAACAVGCGGGGGDDDDDNLRGTWTGSLLKTQDSCTGTSRPSSINFTHLVTQNNEAISVVTEENLTYLGNAQDDNSFSADLTVSGPTSGCEEQRRIGYDRIDDDDDATAEVDYVINQRCAGQADCRVAYEGTAVRQLSTPQPTAVPQGTGTPSATPVPGATGTPDATRGCFAVNPRTASGTYEGNGGCGVSSTVFSANAAVASSQIALTPFGANSVATFTVDANDPAIARSDNSNLTLRGQSGYSCALACSPPSTFTVVCTGAGLTPCTERF